MKSMTSRSVGVLLVVIARAIAARFHLRDLGGGEAEEEEILRADFLADFDIRAVERADGERAVERELHVAGAARFLAGGGDLLGQIGGGINEVRVLHVEVGEEDDLQPVAHGGSLFTRSPMAVMSLMMRFAMK